MRLPVFRRSRAGADRERDAAFLGIVVLVATLLGASNAFATTPAGSVVRNQASATYRDETGVEHFTTSNVVETVIRQTAALTLVQDQTRLAASGRDVVFPHVLTNTGNGVDAFSLAALDRSGDDYDFATIGIFADANQDGLADDGAALARTPSLAAGEAFRFVVVARVPDNTPASRTATLELTATSDFDPARIATALNEATVTGGALVEVEKSMSARAGRAPGGPHRVTLAYRNAGPADALDVTLIDALPDGMRYVAGSGRWSGSGALVLSDADGGDVQGAGVGTVRYCAYRSDCTGLPEATLDPDGDSRDQVTAILPRVPAGASGTLVFDVSIDADLDAGTLPNAAEFEYGDGSTTSVRLVTNTVAFRVVQDVAVVANGSLASGVDGVAEPLVVPSAFQGSSVVYDNVVWNGGNGPDTFDIVVDADASTFPPGSVYRLFREDGLTPLLDSSGNGVPDTGPLEPGERRRVVLRVLLPANAVGDNGGAGYEAHTLARSTLDAGVSNAMLDRLGEILPSSVDLTALAPTGDTDALGEGAGPESGAVLELDARPGTTVRFALHVNNVGDVPDAFTLDASTDPSFAESTLPDGWSVTFRSADDGESITSTGMLLAGAQLQLFADVRVPAAQAPLVQSLNFRVLSATTGADDVLHGAVGVADTATLILEPPLNGQVEPGGAIVHAHRLVNAGNATIANVTLSTSDSLAGEGWSSALYVDGDGDGVFGPGDAPIDSIAALAPGETRVLFVKVFSPANAPWGARDTTTLVASRAGGAESIAIEDVTTIASGDIGIVKLQAPDLGCDGTLDGPFTRAPFSIEPGGNCVRYRLVATNAGVEPVFNAVIEDATPAFTVYLPPASCSAPLCTIVEPSAGGTGRVSGEVSSVAPGASVELTFSVVVE